MRSIQRPNQYLRLRHDVWHYVRRVPKSVRHIDERVLIYRSLETDSRKVARQRRDICAAADDQRWSEITPTRYFAKPLLAARRFIEWRQSYPCGEVTPAVKLMRAAAKARFDEYAGEYDSLEVYAEEFTEQSGLEISQSLAPYIDYKAMAHDYEQSGDFLTFEVRGSIHIFWAQ